MLAIGSTFISEDPSTIALKWLGSQSFLTEVNKATNAILINLDLKQIRGIEDKSNDTRIP